MYFGLYFLWQVLLLLPFVLAQLECFVGKDLYLMEKRGSGCEYCSDVLALAVTV